MNTEIELLERCSLFNGLSSAEIEIIRGRMLIQRFRRNETILRDEDTNKVMYIIMKGRVKVIQTTEEGREIVLSIHGSGDTFGEVSLIDGQTTQARVVAVSDSLIAIISKEDFYDLYHTQDKIIDNLLKLFCARFRESVDHIKMLNLNNATQRIQMFFIKLIHNYGEQGAEGITLRIKLTHNDIASMSGLTRETVTRIMNKWQKDGCIQIKNRLIRLNEEFVRELS